MMSDRRFAWLVIALCGVGGLVVGLLIGLVLRLWMEW